MEYDQPMIQANRILHPTDFSDASAPALDRALFLAQLFSAELHLLHAVVPYTDDRYDRAHLFPERQEIEERLVELARQDLQGLVEPAKAREMILVRSQKRGRSAGAVISEYCAELDIDLVVMGTHGRRGAGRLLLGSVAEEVVHGAPCAVATVPASVPTTPPKKLLVPLDFSDPSRLALAHAIEMAALTDAHVDLVHVIERYRFPPFYTSGGKEALPPDLVDLRDRAEAAMKEMLEETGGSSTTHGLHVVTGKAATAIVDQARLLETDIIVTASHGLT